MTDEERIASARLQLRLLGVHPSWIAHMDDSWAHLEPHHKAATYEILLATLDKHGAEPFSEER